MSGRHFTKIGLVLAIFILALVDNTWAGKPNKPKMHVESVDITLIPQGEPLWTASADVLIRDQNSTPVAGAAVTGDWDLDGSILSSGASAATDNDGIAQIVFGPQNASAGQTFTFTVTNVKLRGLTYDRPGTAPAGSMVVPGVDVTSPVVNSVIPADGATGVQVSTAIEVVFSELIDPGTLAGNFVVRIGTSGINGSIESSANPSITFVPQTSLVENTAYTVTVTGGGSGVKDQNGNSLDSDFSSSFTTGDNILPLGNPGHRLSNNENYFPEPDIFSQTDTLYVQVRSDNIDYRRLKKSEVRLEPWGIKFPLVYNTSGPQSGTYTGNRSLSGAPAGDMAVQIVIEDRSRNKYNATAAITIDEPVDEVSYPFPGIKRTHRTTNIPRPLNINVLEVTLSAPGINLFVSPGGIPESERTFCTEAVLSTTTDFVETHQLQIGINGDFSNLGQLPPGETCETDPGTSSLNGLGVSYRSSETGHSEIPRDHFCKLKLTQ